MAAKTLYETVKEVFVQDDWVFFEAGQKKGLIQLTYQGKSSKWVCYAQVEEEQQLFLFYSIFPFRVEKKRIQAVSDFLNRANYGLKIGNFELDLDDGEIRYKTSVDFEGSTPSTAIISNLVYANLWTMDRYAKGILDVSVGYEDAEKTVREIEGGKEQEENFSEF